MKTCLSVGLAFALTSLAGTFPPEVFTNEIFLTRAERYALSSLSYHPQFLSDFLEGRTISFSPDPASFVLAAPNPEIAAHASFWESKGIWKNFTSTGSEQLLSDEKFVDPEPEVSAVLRLLQAEPACFWLKSEKTKRYYRAYIVRADTWLNHLAKLRGGYSIAVANDAMESFTRAELINLDAYVDPLTERISQTVFQRPGCAGTRKRLN